MSEENTKKPVVIDDTIKTRADPNVNSEVGVQDEIGEDIEAHMVEEWEKELENAKQLLDLEEGRYERHGELLALEKEYNQIIIDGFERIEPIWKYEKNPRYNELAKILRTVEVEQKMVQAEGWRRQQEKIIANLKTRIEELTNNINNSKSEESSNE